MINRLEIKFCAKNTLVASYSRAVIAKKCVEISPSVTVSTIKLERQGIFGFRLNVLESTHLELEFEHKFYIISVEIKSVIVLSICPTDLPEKWIPIMCRWRSTKMKV